MKLLPSLTLPFLLQTNYRGYRTRNHLKKTHDENNIVTFQVKSSRSVSRSYQVDSSKPSSRSPSLSPKYHQDSALEDQRRVQMGKVIRPRLGHDGGTASCETRLKSIKKPSPHCDVVLSSHGYERIRTKSYFQVDAAKEEAAVIIQAGYRGYLVRNNLKKKHQSATTIQTNYRGYRTRNHLKKTLDENNIVTFQVNSSQSGSRSYQVDSIKPSSRSPSLSPKCHQDSALEVQRRVQMGKVIRPRLGHDGGTASCETRLKSIKKPSPRCDVVVSSHGHEKSGMKSNLQVDRAKEEAAVIIQADYGGYLVRNNLRKKHQSATTIQTNYRGYRTRNHLKKTPDENDNVTLQDEPADYNVTNHVDSS
uniref:Uncharacterized protein n=1 Tax=Eptatretus burgeri TaxID=7764 RepID=A0A8C4R597_EPTBU